LVFSILRLVGLVAYRELVLVPSPLLNPAAVSRPLPLLLLLTAVLCSTSSLQAYFTVTSDRISPPIASGRPHNLLLPNLRLSINSNRVRILRPTVVPSSFGLDRLASSTHLSLADRGEHPRITRLSHLCRFWSFCVLLTRSYLAKKHSLDPCPVVPGRHARNNDAALSVVHGHQLLTSPTTQALCPSGLVALGSGSSPPREEFGLEASLDL
jgi:hypothetical protein